MARPLVPKSQAAWKPRVACEVTQMRSWGIAPRTMVQAEAQSPSMITASPELRRPLVFVEVGAAPPAAVVRDPDHGMAWRHSQQQENGRQQPRRESHVLPQFNRNRICRFDDAESRMLPDRDFV